jgi:hypothetical protein
MNAVVRAIIGPLVFAFLLLAWWFDHRGFLHGMAFMAQVCWLWSIRPRRSANIPICVKTDSKPKDSV